MRKVARNRATVQPFFSLENSKSSMFSSSRGEPFRIPAREFQV